MGERDDRWRELLDRLDGLEAQLGNLVSALTWQSKATERLTIMVESLRAVESTAEAELPYQGDPPPRLVQSPEDFNDMADWGDKQIDMLREKLRHAPKEEANDRVDSPRLLDGGLHSGREGLESPPSEASGETVLREGKVPGRVQGSLEAEGRDHESEGE